MPSVIQGFNQSIRDHGLLSKGERVLIAVSGGPDSVALFKLFTIVQRKWNLSLVVAHVNHRLRGKDSDEDQAFVKRLANSSSIPYRTKSLKPPRRLKSQSLEEHMRNARYRYLTDLSRRLHIQKIATGHTMDDQAETVFMRIIRGTGIRGLNAMRPHKNLRGLTIIRPLLKISKKDLIRFLRMSHHSFRTDQSNHESRFTRNRVRSVLLPLISQEFNPQFGRSLTDLAETSSVAYDWISRKSRERYRQLVKKKGESLSIPLQALHRTHPALRNEIYLHALQDLTGHMKQLSKIHLSSLDRLTRSPSHKPLRLPHCVNATRGPKLLTLRRI